MISEAEIRGMKNLASAILRSALSDAEKGYSYVLLESFATSEWCEALCGIVNISWVAYKRELAKKVTEHIEKCRLKRLKTYELIGVLKYGKNTRTDQTSGIAKLSNIEQSNVGEMGKQSEG